MAQQSASPRLSAQPRVLPCLGHAPACASAYKPHLQTIACTSHGLQHRLIRHPFHPPRRRLVPQHLEDTASISSTYPHRTLTPIPDTSSTTRASHSPQNGSSIPTSNPPPSKSVLSPPPPVTTVLPSTPSPPSTTPTPASPSPIRHASPPTSTRSTQTTPS